MSKSDIGELHRVVINELINRFSVSLENRESTVIIGRDFQQFLLDGLIAARDGNPDPFNLQVKGRRGAPQRLTMTLKCKAWHEVQDAYDKGIEITESIRLVANSHAVSFETMREIYYDKLVKERAYFTRKTPK